MSSKNPRQRSTKSFGSLGADKRAARFSTLGLSLRRNLGVTFLYSTHTRIESYKAVLIFGSSGRGIYDVKRFDSRAFGIKLVQGPVVTVGLRFCIVSSTVREELSIDEASRLSEMALIPAATATLDNDYFSSPGCVARGSCKPSNSFTFLLLRIIFPNLVWRLASASSSWFGSKERP